jgi:hypothetical protein
MNRTRDTQYERPALREGRRARARYRGGTVEGEVLEVRRAGGATRVVLVVDGETELDTDASRVDLVGPTCPNCETALSRTHAYRCPECGADLVE